MIHFDIYLFFPTIVGPLWSAVAASENMVLVGWCTVGSKSGFSGWNRMLTTFARGAQVHVWGDLQRLVGREDKRTNNRTTFPALKNN